MSSGRPTPTPARWWWSSGGACAGCGISDITADNIRSDLILDFEAVEDVTVKVPSSGDHGSSTVEGGRGGELQYGTDDPGHF